MVIIRIVSNIHTCPFLLIPCYLYSPVSMQSLAAGFMGNPVAPEGGSSHSNKGDSPEKEPAVKSVGIMCS